MNWNPVHGGRGHDCMIVGFTTICAIGAYHHLSCEFKSCSWQVPSWPWLYDSWIYNYLCNQYISPLKLWVQIPLMVECILDITLCDQVCQWFGTWHVCGFLSVLNFPAPIKLTATIYLKYCWKWCNTIIPPPPPPPPLKHKYI